MEDGKFAEIRGMNAKTAFFNGNVCKFRENIFVHECSKELSLRAPPCVELASDELESDYVDAEDCYSGSRKFGQDLRQVLCR